MKNLYGWAKPQKLPESSFKWVGKTNQFNEDLINSYNQDSDLGSFFEASVQNSEKLHRLHNDLPFLTERLKIGKF